MPTECKECRGYEWLCNGSCTDPENHVVRKDCKNPADCGTCKIKQEEKDFLVLLRSICKRPAMYVGIAKIRLVTTLILGLSWGHDTGKRGGSYASIGGGKLVNGFWSWAMSQYDTPISHPGWGLDRILLHFNDHDHLKAIAAIAPLYEKWLEEKETFFKKTMEEHKQEDKARLLEKYGKDWGAPDCDKCEGWQL